MSKIKLQDYSDDELIDNVINDESLYIMSQYDDRQPLLNTIDDIFEYNQDQMDALTEYLDSEDK